jgi:ElaB/YqjD/DUF883 family membrane-anchored ribosome-binding protein
MTQADSAGREATGGSASEPIRETLSSLGDAAGDKAREILSASREKIDQIRNKSLEEIYDDAKNFIRENPGKSLLGALAAGFILGRIFRRR